MNGKYYLNHDLFLQLEESGKRGHDLKLFKKRFGLYIRKYAFCNRWSMAGVEVNVVALCSRHGMVI